MEERPVELDTEQPVPGEVAPSPVAAEAAAEDNDIEPEAAVAADEEEPANDDEAVEEQPATHDEEPETPAPAAKKRRLVEGSLLTFVTKHAPPPANISVHMEAYRYHAAGTREVCGSWSCLRWRVCH